MKHILIPILLGLVIWIITAVARSAKAKAAKEQVKPVEPNQGRPPRRRPSSADIDRFLDEVKRRQSEQRRRQAEPPVVEPVVIEPSPLRKPPPVRRPPTRRVIVEPTVVAEVIPIALPAEAPKAALGDIAIPVLEAAKAKHPEHMLELRRLLHSSHGLRAALLVNEILGPPKCKRGRSL
jgi:hypothetical protein